MKYINKFELFESDSVKFLDNKDMEYYFMELIDNGFSIKFYNGVSYLNGKYFFEFKKDISEESVGHIDKGNAYGSTNIKFIQTEINNVLDILEESKNRLQAIGYDIGFEFEFNIIGDSSLNIVCHVQHKSVNTELEEDNDYLDDTIDGEWDQEAYLRPVRVQPPGEVDYPF